MGDVSPLLQFLFSGLTTGSIYALIAVSLVIVYKVSLLICFAQGEFFVIGALAMATLVSKGLPMPVAFGLSVLVAMVLGALVERVLIRPIQNSGTGNLIVMTIAISLALRGSALLIWGKESHVLAPFSAGIPLQVFGATLQPQVLWIVGITFVALLAIWLFFEKTTMGIAMRACAENRLGASLMGISTQKAALFSWAWGAGIGALAGMAVSPLLFYAVHERRHAHGEGLHCHVDRRPRERGRGRCGRISARSRRGLHDRARLLRVLRPDCLYHPDRGSPFPAQWAFRSALEQGRMTRLARFWWLLVLLFIAFYPQTLGGMSPYRCGILIFAGIYVILAGSLDLLMGYAGQISVGHAAFFAIGAYVSGILTARYGVSPLPAMIAGILLRPGLPGLWGDPFLR